MEIEVRAYQKQYDSAPCLEIGRSTSAVSLAAISLPEEVFPRCLRGQLERGDGGHGQPGGFGAGFGVGVIQGQVAILEQLSM